MLDTPSDTFKVPEENTFVRTIPRYNQRRFFRIGQSIIVSKRYVVAHDCSTLCFHRITKSPLDLTMGVSLTTLANHIPDPS